MDAIAHIREIEEQGYTVLENVIEPDLTAELNDALLRIEHDEKIRPGANSFEGHHTIRIYNLLARAAVFRQIPTHPALLPVVEGILDEGCLISSLSSISIDPGEGAQPLHVDDTLIGLRRPHQAVVCNSMWALTDFTEANGATRIVPGSHLWDRRPEYGESYDTIAAEMPRGSLLIWNGSLWHGGGANQSGERRVGIAMNYCAGFFNPEVQGIILGFGWGALGTGKVIGPWFQFAGIEGITLRTYLKDHGIKVMVSEEIQELNCFCLLILHRQAGLTGPIDISDGRHPGRSEFPWHCR